MKDKKSTASPEQPSLILAKGMLQTISHMGAYAHGKFSIGAVTAMKEGMAIDLAEFLEYCEQEYTDYTDEMQCSLHGIAMRAYWTGLSSGIELERHILDIVIEADDDDCLDTLHINLIDVEKFVTPDYIQEMVDDKLLHDVFDDVKTDTSKH